MLNKALQRLRINELKRIYLVILCLLHAFLDEVGLLQCSFEVHRVAFMRFHHLQISFELWKLLSIDWEKKFEDKKSWPDAEIGKRQRIARHVNMSASEESFHILIATHNSINFIGRDRSLATITNCILKPISKLDVMKPISLQLTQISKSLANKKLASKKSLSFTRVRLRKSFG